MKNEKEVSLKKLMLLVTVVDRRRAIYYADLLQGFECNVQLAFPARGTARKEMLEVLGLADTEKAVVFSVIRKDRADEALQKLDEKFKTLRGGNGIAFTIPMSSVIGVSVFGFLANDHRTIREGEQ